MGQSTSKHGTFVCVYDGMAAKKTIAKISKRLDSARDDVEWANEIASAWRAAAVAARSSADSPTAAADPSAPARLRVLKHDSKTKNVSFDSFSRSTPRNIDVRAVKSDDPHLSDEILYIPEIRIEVFSAGVTGPSSSSSVGPFGISMPYSAETAQLCIASRLFLTQAIMLIRRNYDISEQMICSFGIDMCRESACVRASAEATCGLVQLFTRLRGACIGPDNKFRLSLQIRPPKASPSSPAPLPTTPGVLSRIRADLSAVESGFSVISIPLDRSDADSIEQSVRSELRKLVPSKFSDFTVLVNGTRIDKLSASIMACGWSPSQITETMLARLDASGIRVLPL